MALTGLVIGGVFLATRVMFPLAVGAGVVGLILLLFATMTVIVDDGAVEARFGIGVVRKRVPFASIRAYRVVRNPWYYGWGIHFIPGGILYNASGLSAIELQLTNGAAGHTATRSCSDASGRRASMNGFPVCAARPTGSTPANAVRVVPRRHLGKRPPLRHPEPSTLRRGAQ
jgi:hypothetical protein